MKAIRFIALSIILFLFLISTTYMYVTSEGGREYLKKIAETKINEQLNLGIMVDTVVFDYATFTLAAHDKYESNISIEGRYSFFPRFAEADYKINVVNLKHYANLIDAEFDAPLSIEGIAVKKSAFIDTNGSIKLFSGDVRFDVSMKNTEIEIVKLLGKELSAHDMLESKGLPNLLWGNFEFMFDGVFEKAEIAKGDFTIASNNLSLNKESIKDNYGVSIKPKSDITIDLVGTLGKNKINTSLAVVSDFLEISSNRLKYAFDSKSADVLLDFSLSDISYGGFEFNQSAKGEIRAQGELANINAGVKVNIFDTPIKGDLGFVNEKLDFINLYAKDIDLEKILSFSEFQNLGKGVVSAEVNLEKLNGLESKGSIKIDSRDIKIDKSALNTLTNLNFPKDISLILEATMDIDEGKGNGYASIISQGDKVMLENIKIDIPEKKINSDLRLDIAKMEEINPLKERKLNGELRVVGNLEANESRKFLFFQTESFGGDLNVTMDNQNLKVNAKTLNLVTLLRKSGENLPLRDGKIDLLSDVNFDENISYTEGFIRLQGRKILLEQYDIDKIIDSFDKSNKIDLVDIGAFALAGPLGLAVTKGTDVGGLGLGAAIKGVSTIEHLNADITLGDLEAKMNDVAFATKKNRVAINGAIGLENQDFRGFQVGLLREDGCAKYVQDINGTLKNPQIETAKSILSMPLNLVGSLLKNSVGLVAGKEECKVFYDGAVKALNAQSK